MQSFSHRGQKVFHVSLMGFINSVPCVQRQMDIQLKEFTEFCKVYIDDIVVASVSFEEHLLHSEAPFQHAQ